MQSYEERCAEVKRRIAAEKRKKRLRRGRLVMAAAAVAEMLIQSRKRHFLLLPALPDEWKDGKVGGMKAQGDITVDFEWREGRIHRVRLCSSREQKVTLECNGISKTVFLKPDGTENMIFD